MLCGAIRCWKRVPVVLANGSAGDILLCFVWLPPPGSFKPCPWFSRHGKQQDSTHPTQKKGQQPLWGLGFSAS